LAGLQRALQMVRTATDEIAGPLRIVGPRSTFLPVLWPVLDEFCRLYPAVQPDVQLDDRIGNWVEDRVDVGFRVGRSAEEGVVARRLFSLQLIICAAPDYIARHGAPDSLPELANHRCSVFRHPATGRLLPWHLQLGGAIVDQDIAGALSTNEEQLEIEAVMAGHVIGMLTGVTAAAHIRSGRLVPLLVAHIPDHLGVFVYYGSRTSQPARARAFIDLVIERLVDNRQYFLSTRELVSAETKGRKAFSRRTG
jgi:DNA-binding transcriptional LysR family regulator